MRPIGIEHKSMQNIKKYKVNSAINPQKNMQLVWIEHTTFRLTVTESLQSDALPTELKLQQNPRRESNSQSFD